MARHDVRWERIHAHLEKWAAELDRAKVTAEAEVARVQTQYYERLAELRAEIEQSLERWDTEIRALRERAETTGAEAAHGIEEFRRRIQAEITEWQPELDRLKSTAGKTRVEARRLAGEIEARGKRATGRLKDLKRTAAESWSEIRPALEKAWAELRPALQTAAAKLRETGRHEPGTRPNDDKDVPTPPSSGG
jgi:chromosome segregation ATPase